MNLQGAATEPRADALERRPIDSGEAEEVRIEGEGTRKIGDDDTNVMERKLSHSRRLTQWLGKAIRQHVWKQRMRVLRQKSRETKIDRLAWRHQQPHRNKAILCHSQIAVHILSTEFLRESHQHRPVRTLAHILGSLLGCSVTAATATDKGTHVDSVFARCLPAYVGDER